MGHHFQNQDVFDPYAAQTPHGNKADDGENDEELDEYYYEGLHGKYDDFFVIPNEQYNKGSDDEDQITAAHGRQAAGRKQPREYIIDDMNKIVESIDKEIGWQWDKKKESFTRRRLMAYLLEDRSSFSNKANKLDSGKKKFETSKDSWLSDIGPITDKQNLSIYGNNICPKRLL